MASSLAILGLMLGLSPESKQRVMNLPTPAKVCLALGIMGLVLAVANQLTAGSVDPALERSAVLASFLAVGLMLVAVLWTKAVPEAAERAPLDGVQGFWIEPAIPEGLAVEMAWGSHMLLVATPAAVVVVLWRGQEILRRGLLAPDEHRTQMVPGSICARALDKQAAISLVDLRLYPGRDEFETVLAGLPSVVVQPVGAEGLLLLGGWSARCFSRSDLAWAKGWADKLRAELEALELPEGGNPAQQA